MINRNSSLKNNIPELLKEWNYEKNSISPENISIWSKEKVWWKCTNGHEWISAIVTRKKGTSCPYCSGKLPIVGVSDLATTTPELLKEWDYDKNTKKPTEIKAGSGDKVWWKCKEGHSWEDSPNHRSGGRGCPFCAGKRVFIGYNDLKSLEPEISQEWNYELNGDDLPENHTVRSGKKVWWKCKYGHEWEATVCSRTGKTKPGCPFCAGLKAVVGLSDLATTNPELLNEWNYEKNVMIKPQDVKCGSSNMVWWKCKNGHEWKAVISSRTLGKNGCPFCSGRNAITGENDLVSIKSSLLDEWNYIRNAGVDPSKLKEGSSKKVWWKCKNGHEWEAKISERNKGKACPFCSGKKLLNGYNDLMTIFPEIAKEWNYDKNCEKKPQDYMSKAGKKVWWKCEKGHEWEATIANRSFRGDGCPKCSASRGTSFPEQAIYFYIKQVYPDAINRFTEGFSNRKEIDIYIPSIKTGIEFDGIAWHNTTKALEREFDKYVECKDRGIFLIRIKDINGLFCEGTCDILLRIVGNYDNTSFKSLFDELGKYIEVSTDIDIDRDRIKIQECYKSEFTNNSLGARFPHLVFEWDKENNGQLTPFMFRPKSSEKVFWKCKKNHSWKASISDRVKGTGCPYCSGRRAIRGENDLATLRPDIIKEWNYDRNSTIDPTLLKCKSNKKVWWRCAKGHEWMAIISNRTVRGDGCPICKNS